MLRRIAPRQEQLRSSRWLAWLGPRLHEPQLWRWRRRPVARGVAIGAFLAVLLPVGQIPLALLAGFVLRANLVACATATFLSNPLTFGPLYYAAYHLGAALLARPPRAVASLPAARADLASLQAWAEFAVSLGPPLLLGVAALAPLVGVIAYAVTSAAWRIRVTARWRARRRRLRGGLPLAQPESVRW